jgi:hypothetical protein
MSKASSYNPHDHAPLVPLVHMGYAPSGHSILGVASHKPLTHAQSEAVQRHVNAISAHHEAAVHAAEAGAKARAAAKALQAAIAKAKPVIATLDPKHAHAIHGMLGVAYMLGVDANGLSPGQQGYDPTTDPDAMGASVPSTTSPQPIDPTQFGLPPVQPLYTDGNGANPDPNLVAMPTRGQPLSSDDAQADWEHMPDDGVTFAQGSASIPRDAVTSWGRAYQGFGDGFYWAGGLDGHGWMRRQGYPANDDNDAPLSYIQQLPHGPSGNWGPLVGKPDGPVPGLQFARADGTFFWQSQHAPATATAQQDAALADLNAKTLAADNATITAQNAQILQDAAAMQEAQAKQNAANALAESQAQTATDVAAQQLQVQQAQIDQQAQQAQQRQDAAQAQADLQIAQTQAQQQAQAEQIWLDYLKQNPQAMFEQAPSGDAGGYGAQQDDGSGGSFQFGDALDS